MPKMTLTLSEAANLLGISKSGAYNAARSNNFPTKVIQIGGRYVVPTRPLLDLLGLEALPETPEVA